MNQRLMGAVCLIVVCITLSLGLSPFHKPDNTVTWTKNADGVVFGKTGTMQTSGPLEISSSWKDPSGSVEIWVQPATWTSATLLSLYRPEEGVLIRLRQWYDDLDVVAETRDESGHVAATSLKTEGAFNPALHEKKPAFVAATVGPRGANIYFDGALVMSKPRFWIPADAFSGRLIVGDSPRQPDSFRGQVRGLAIYATELSGEEVLHHYQSWLQQGRPNVNREQHGLALYLFNEKTGDVVHNQYGAYGDLHIPATYGVVDKIALEPFWSEFEFSRSYWRGNIKNIIGFMPLGICFCAYFSAVRPLRRAILFTLIAGFLVSLAIEVGQSALPNRDSGTTDIITNTLGTWLGVLCYERIYPMLAKKLSGHVRFPPAPHH